MKKLNKTQTLELLQINNVTSSNIKSFSNSHAKFNLNIDKCKKWLLVEENKSCDFRIKALAKTNAKRFGMSVVKYNELIKKAKDILADFGTGHSMGYCGYIKIKGKIFEMVDETSEYGRSYKYRAVHGTFSINISKQQLVDIEKNDGVWTIKEKHHKVKWLESDGHKGNYNVFLQNGFLFGKSHACTLKSAKELFRTRLIQEQRVKLNDAKFIGIEHLKSAGACIVGIKSFAKRHKLNLDWGYNLLYLKTLETNSFLNNL